MEVDRFGPIRGILLRCLCQAFVVGLSVANIIWTVSQGPIGATIASLFIGVVCGVSGYRYFLEIKDQLED